MESKQLQKINNDFKKILKPQRNKNELNKSIWEKERKKKHHSNLNASNIKRTKKEKYK